MLLIIGLGLFVYGIYEKFKGNDKGNKSKGNGKENKWLIQICGYRILVLIIYIATTLYQRVLNPFDLLIVFICFYSLLEWIGLVMKTYFKIKINVIHKNEEKDEDK